MSSAMGTRTEPGDWERLADRLALPLPMVRGFLVGVCSVPTAVEADDWQKQLCADLAHKPAQEAQQLRELMARCSAQTVVDLNEHRQVWPDDGEHTAVRGWCASYLHAMRLGGVSDDDEADMWIFTIGVLAGEIDPQQVEFREGSARDPSSLVDKCRALLPLAVVGLYEYWASRAQSSAKPSLRS